MWSGSADAPPTARIAMLAPSLHPTERRVAESIASDVEAQFLGEVELVGTSKPPQPSHVHIKRFAVMPRTRFHGTHY